MSEDVLSRFPHTGRAPNGARREAVTALYRSGLSLRQVAIQLGCTPQAVQSLLKRAGVKRRKPGGNRGSHSRHKK